MRASLWKRLLLMLVSFGFCGLGLEAATRTFLPVELMEPAVPANVGQFDEDLGWSLKPLSVGTSRRTGYEISYRINSKGLRDAETSYEKPDDTFRIVLLGDSRTFGYGVPIEKHFSTLLEGYFVDVDVINMGVSGFGVDQELLFLQSEGVRYQPDLVIAYVAHYSSHRHMHTQRFGKQKPRFSMVDGELILSDSPIDIPESSAGLFRTSHRWLVKHSEAYSILRRAVVNLSRPGQFDGRNQLSEDEKNLEDKAFVQELHQLGERIVAEMHATASAHGAAFALVTEVEELHKACLDTQLVSLDVSGSLANPMFDLPDDLKHINESGNGVLAWEIAKFLRAKELIPVERWNKNQSPKF